MMTTKSKRVARVLRKYTIDRRLAQLAYAKAEANRAALQVTECQLFSARNRLPGIAAIKSGADLAAVCEWSDRLDSAMQRLQPAIELAQETVAEAARSAKLAAGRADCLENRCVDLRRSEDRQKEARSAATVAGRRQDR